MTNTNQNDTASKSNSSASETASRHQLALRIAWIAGVFCACVLIVLLVDFVRRPSCNPSDYPDYVAMKDQLKLDPQNTELTESIREMDLRLRHDYFRSRDFARLGGVMLLIGLAVWFATMKYAATLREKLPEPQPKCCGVDPDALNTPLARYGVGVLFAVVIGFFVGMYFSTHSEIALLDRADIEARLAAIDADNTGNGTTTAAGNQTETADDNNTGNNQGTQATVEPVTPVQPYWPTAEQMDRNWPTFRGADGSGHSRYNNIPLEWDAEAGDGVLWKTSVPLPGKNSPVVWGDRVFVCGADETTRQVYCFNADSGQLLWTTDAPGTPESTAEPPEVSEDTGFAAPTMAVDGRYAFAMFANGDVVAVDFEGNVVWSKSLGMPDNMYGHSASLALFEDSLIIQYDQGSDSDGLSKLYALDTANGQQRWATSRDVGNSWSSPIVVTIDGWPQIVTAAAPWVIGYNPRTGEEIWRCEACDGDMGPSPVAQGNMVFTATEYYQLSAIDATGTGDVTETHLKWSGDWGLPDTSSPLINGDQVYLLESSGYITCYHSESGEMLWELETDAAVAYSSLALAGEHLYLFGPDGIAYVIKPGETEDDTSIINECAMPEKIETCPAFQDGRIYIRGEEHLFCIGK